MTIDRYILRMFLLPFTAFLLVVTGVLLLGRMLKVLETFSSGGLGLAFLLELLAAILPYFLVLTAPIAFFFGAQSVVMRLSQDSEMDAMRAAGLSYARVFRSVVISGVILTLFLVYVAMVWMPHGTKSFRTIFYSGQNVKSLGFTPQRFTQDFDSLRVYVDGKNDEGQYINLLMEDRRSPVPVIYIAETAEMTTTAAGLQFTLRHGTRLEGEAAQLRLLAFDEYKVAVSIDALNNTSTDLPWQSRLLEMSPIQLWHTIKKSGKSDAWAEWNRRLLLPSTVLVLLLFVLPLSLAPKRSGKAGAFVLSALVVLLVYNVQIMLHRQVSGDVWPWWSMWLAQAGLLATGFELSRRASLDRLPSLLVWVGETIYLLHNLIIGAIARRKAS